MLGVHERPIIGNWYLDLGNSERFEIVAIDEPSQTLEIQHFGGDVEEIELDNWMQMRVVTIPAPEDWSGPYDDVDKELYTVLKDDDLPSFDNEAPLDHFD
jgi:Family of unknown function (DUF6763)